MLLDYSTDLRMILLSMVKNGGQSYYHRGWVGVWAAPGFCMGFVAFRGAGGMMGHSHQSSIVLEVGSSQSHGQLTNLLSDW
ncbi:unnamed protein product [Malus baccata var. baccata]